jgi:hypothetical protein
MLGARASRCWLRLVARPSLGRRSPHRPLRPPNLNCPLAAQPPSPRTRPPPPLRHPVHAPPTPPHPPPQPLRCGPSRACAALTSAAGTCPTPRGSTTPQTLRSSTCCRGERARAHAGLAARQTCFPAKQRVRRGPEGRRQTLLEPATPKRWRGRSADAARRTPPVCSRARPPALARAPPPTATCTRRTRSTPSARPWTTACSSASRASAQACRTLGDAAAPGRAAAAAAAGAPAPRWISRLAARAPQRRPPPPQPVRGSGAESIPPCVRAF